MGQKLMADVPVQGTCVTANGSVEVSRMSAHSLDGGLAEVRFVSSRLHRSLRSGARLRAGDLDEFCTAWLTARQRPLDVRPTSFSDMRLGVLKRVIGDLLNAVDALEDRGV
jgi:hypothetical protein